MPSSFFVAPFFRRLPFACLEASLRFLGRSPKCEARARSTTPGTRIAGCYRQSWGPPFVSKVFPSCCRRAPAVRAKALRAESSDLLPRQAVLSQVLVVVVQEVVRRLVVFGGSARQPCHEGSARGESNESPTTMVMTTRLLLGFSSCVRNVRFFLECGLEVAGRSPGAWRTDQRNPPIISLFDSCNLGSLT